jgi:hypothetical protein
MPGESVRPRCNALMTALFYDPYTWFTAGMCSESALSLGSVTSTHKVPLCHLLPFLCLLHHMFRRCTRGWECHRLSMGSLLSAEHRGDKDALLGPKCEEALQLQTRFILLPRRQPEREPAQADTHMVNTQPQSLPLPHSKTVFSKVALQAPLHNSVTIQQKEQVVRQNFYSCCMHAPQIKGARTSGRGGPE